MKIIRQNHFGTTIVHVLKDICEIVAILDTQLTIIYYMPIDVSVFVKMEKIGIEYRQSP